MEAIKDVGFGGFRREARDGKSSDGIRLDGGAIGHGDIDGWGVCGDRSGAVRSRGKEVAGGSGVSYYGLCGRGINRSGANRFS